jgi:hypothetical protein
MLKDKLELLNKEFNLLKEKIKVKLQTKDNQVKQKEQELVKVKEEKQKTAHQLELCLKENQENEKVLAQLLGEFKELMEQLN